MDELSSKPHLRVLEFREGLGVVHLMLGLYMERERLGSCRVILHDRNHWRATEREPTERPPAWVAELSGMALDEDRVRTQWLPVKFVQMVLFRLWRDYRVQRIGTEVKYKDAVGQRVLTAAGFMMAPHPADWPWGEDVGYMLWEPSRIGQLESMVDDDVPQSSARREFGP